MKNALLFVTLLLALQTSGCTAAAEPRSVTFRTRTMGTVAALTLVTADSASVADLAYGALLSLHHTDSLLTNWTETSEVARINRRAGRETVTLDAEANRVLTVAAAVGAASSGAFDITVEPLVRLWGFLDGTPAVPEPAAITTALTPVGWSRLQHDAAAGTLKFLHPATRIDLGGVAKGYGVDRVAEILRDAGVANALIDLSGNMVALGAAPGKPGWTLGIMDPADRDAYLARLSLRDAAVATSGNYLQYVMQSTDRGTIRYGHILDPRTGWPAAGMASATVVAPDAATADAWATAFIVLDARQARALAQAHPELHVVLVEPAMADLQVIWVEEALRDDFTLPEDRLHATQVRYF
jgi:thiamine biosynthesis lipoprotein